MNETIKRYTELMRAISDQVGVAYDEEIGHSDADDLLCNLLSELGADEMVKMFRDLPKWYA